MQWLGGMRRMTPPCKSSWQFSYYSKLNFWLHLHHFSHLSTACQSKKLKHLKVILLYHFCIYANSAHFHLSCSKDYPEEQKLNSKTVCFQDTAFFQMLFWANTLNWLGAMINIEPAQSGLESCHQLRGQTPPCPTKHSSWLCKGSCPSKLCCSTRAACWGTRASVPTDCGGLDPLGI